MTCDCDTIKDETVRACVRNAAEVGSCNFCNRHITGGVSIPGRVLELGGAGRGILVRLCADCCRDILPAMKRFAR